MDWHCVMGRIVKALETIRMHDELYHPKVKAKEPEE
jgi:hypothetical protein